MIIETIHSTSILKEIPTSGHSPLLVLGSDFNLYVTKNDKGKEPPFALINECLAYFFLGLWNIERPSAKLIRLSPELLRSQELSRNHKIHYYNQLCFGSKFVQNAIDLNAFMLSDSRKSFNKLINPLNLFRITLFDTWIENDDRKPTNYNLILKPEEGKFKILPIDNAFIFSTLNYKDLNPAFGATVSSNEHLLVSELGFMIKKYMPATKDFINSEKEYFYLCVQECRKYFSEVVAFIVSNYLLDPSLVSTLEQFLFDDKRNKQVFEEYIVRINQ